MPWADGANDLPQSDEGPTVTTIRHLDDLFKPESIAVIGASRKEQSVGRVLARNLFNSGFQGPILPVHPRHRSIEGVLGKRQAA